MRYPLASLFLVLSGFGNFALAQQSAAPAVPVSDQDKPRVYITDSNSWSTQSSAGGSHGAFGASSSGGARPQTAEIIKTFGQRCPQITVNNRADASNYIVELDHEGGKSVFAHKDKIAVFVQKTGDSIFSESTLSVGGSVKDACAALLAHWSEHSSELKTPTTAVGQGGLGEGVSGGTSSASTIASAQQSSITVDASAPNCDIEVDGNFVGNTPSTLNLTPGKHQVTVKKAGYQEWSRSMLVASGSVRLSAEMVKK
ncbi:PEGA domain-containing protein [Tunturibacter psychrotolerans]|uniref:PEGA domain-containing protein n=1 Tax=Tunturiibacter psychrotolerans TaxID=3069686 RepID=A0AAU7ZRE2_9BACT